MSNATEVERKTHFEIPAAGWEGKGRSETTALVIELVRALLTHEYNVCYSATKDFD